MLLAESPAADDRLRTTSLATLRALSTALENEWCVTCMCRSLMIGLSWFQAKEVVCFVCVCTTLLNHLC